MAGRGGENVDPQQVTLLERLQAFKAQRELAKQRPSGGPTHRPPFVVGSGWAPSKAADAPALAARTLTAMAPSKRAGPALTPLTARMPASSTSRPTTPARASEPGSREKQSRPVTPVRPTTVRPPETEERLRQWDTRQRELRSRIEAAREILSHPATPTRAGHPLLASGSGTTPLRPLAISHAVEVPLPGSPAFVEQGLRNLTVRLQQEKQAIALASATKPAVPARQVPPPPSTGRAASPRRQLWAASPFVEWEPKRAPLEEPLEPLELEVRKHVGVEGEDHPDEFHSFDGASQGGESTPSSPDAPTSTAITAPGSPHIPVSMHHGQPAVEARAPSAASFTTYRDAPTTPASPASPGSEEDSDSGLSPPCLSDATAFLRCVDWVDEDVAVDLGHDLWSEPGAPTSRALTGAGGEAISNPSTLIKVEPGTGYSLRDYVSDQLAGGISALALQRQLPRTPVKQEVPTEVDQSERRGSVTILAPVSLPRREREQFGVNHMLTPVRRAVRHLGQEDLEQEAGDEATIERMLERHGYAFMPNPALSKSSTITPTHR